MKTCITLLSVCSILQLSSALMIPRRDISLFRATIIQEPQTLLAKRELQEDVITTSSDEYVITVNVGTPPQPIKVALNTGSNNLIIPSIECPPDHCTRAGLFNPSKSSTYKNNSTPIDAGVNMDYILSGYWGTKTVNIMGSSVDNLSVGFITDSLNQTYGYLGLGYSTDSKPTLFSHLFKNNTTIQGGVLSLHIDRRSNGITKRGEIIFGGSDSTKYTRNLVTTVNNPESNNTYTNWHVSGQYTSASTNTGSAISKSFNNTNVIIDSSTPISFFPKDMADGIVSIFNPSDIKYNDVQKAYDITCGNYNGYNIEFVFGPNESPGHIKIPLSQIIIRFSNNQCVLPISTSDTVFMLGFSVVYKYYMVFDTVQYKISFGNIPGSTATVSTQ